MPTAQEIQDATLLIHVFEEHSMNSMSEESAFVPLARIVNMMQTEMGVMEQTFTPQEQLANDVMVQGGVDANAAVGEYLGQFGIDSSQLGAVGPQTDTTGKTNWQPPDAVKAIASYFTDCIPCAERANFLAWSTPELPFDLFNAMLDDLTSRLAFLNEVLDILGDTSVWGDLCTLMEFLSFMCIPDLVGMLIFLSGLMTKYNTDALSNLNLLPGFWITNIFYVPLATVIMSVISRYIGQMEGLVKCVSNSLERQISKMDVTRLKHTEIGNVFGKEFIEKGKWASETNKKIKAQTDGIVWGLDYLKSALDAGIDYVEDEVKSWGDVVKDFLSGGDTSNWNIANYIRTKVILSRLIGVVRFVIELATKRAQEQWSADVSMRGIKVTCSTPDEAYQRMLNDFSHLFSDVVSGRVQVERDKNGQIVDISWSPFPSADELKEDAEDYASHFKQEDDKSMEKQTTPLTEDPDDNDDIRAKISELMKRKVTISCNNIGALLSGEDASKFQQWMDDLLEE